VSWPDPIDQFSEIIIRPSLSAAILFTKASHRISHVGDPSDDHYGHHCDFRVRRFGPFVHWPPAFDRFAPTDVHISLIDERVIDKMLMGQIRRNRS
jgi:hypothetical protein